MNFALHDFGVGLHCETIIFKSWVTTMTITNPWSYKIKKVIKILIWRYFFIFWPRKLKEFLKLPQRWRMRWTSSWPRKICTVRWWPRSGFTSTGTATMNRPIPAQHFLRYWVWFQGVLQSSVSNSATKTTLENVRLFKS